MLCWRVDLFFLPPILCDLDDIPCTWKLFLSANYGNLWFQVLETCVLIFIQHDEASSYTFYNNGLCNRKKILPKVCTN